jgi:hypothetical protein
MSDSKAAALLGAAARGARSAGQQALRTGSVVVEEIRRRRGSGAAAGDGRAPGGTGRPSPRPSEEAAEPTAAEPERAPDGEPATGFPEPPGKDPGDISHHAEPHHALNNPVVDDPDPTEWPDPYDRRDDPLDPQDPDGEPFGAEPHTQAGATSTSDPHPSQDPEAGDRWEGPKRDKVDD